MRIIDKLCDVIRSIASLSFYYLIFWSVMIDDEVRVRQRVLRGCRRNVVRVGKNCLLLFFFHGTHWTTKRNLCIIQKRLLLKK